MSAYRLSKILPQLGELFDKSEISLEILAINSADKFDVVSAGQKGLKCTAKCERP